MIFTEFRFLVFFLIAFAVHWGLRGARARKAWLLLCSYAFYGAWNWSLLSLIVASTWLDYIAGLGLGRTVDPRRRKRWLLVSLVGNLGLLGFFKYFDFFVESGAAFLGWLGIPASVETLQIVLPVGISFYTFQTLSYSIDVYRGRLAPTRDLLDLALFVGFFPQLVAGPIVRAADFLPQLVAPRRFDRVDVRAALVLFGAGFFKKAVVSDGVAALVDAWFADPAAWDALSAWTAVILYGVQIYCDFSGYSDMAIATAALLGYNVCRNFEHPYLATDIRSFWRRWHISLSTWLRDYLYVPLGGSRGGTLFTWRNLMLTMLLGGLWHGAAWRFVMWGGLHGLALIAHKQWSDRVGSRLRLGAAGVVLAWLLTQWWVGLAWIFFRAEDMGTAWTGVRAWVLLESPGTGVLGPRLLLLVLVLFVLHLLTWAGAWRRWWERVPRWSFAVVYGTATAAVLSIIHPQAEAFIYFQF